MFEFYLDTADLAQIARFNACIPVHGVTTNPSILAKSTHKLSQLLPALTEVLGEHSRIFVQVVSEDAIGMIDEAERLIELPYNLVIKIPATEIGLTAIKRLKAQNLPVLATAIYSVQQGFLAALCGADYLAPYVNRIDNFGMNGVGVVADLQLLLEKHQLPSKLLPASFKNTQQVIDVLKLGVASITLPIEVAEQFFAHPAVIPAVQQFSLDWQSVFGNKLAYDV